MSKVKFKVIDMLGMTPVELKAAVLPRQGETIWLANEEGTVLHVDHSFQRSVTGGYSFKEYVVVVGWK